MNHEGPGLRPGPSTHEELPSIRLLQPAPLLEVQIGSQCITDDGTRIVECPLWVRSAHHSPYTGTKENSMQFP
jgi:hypothetical protein